MPSLFAVLLGGNCAPRSNAELHDVVFAVGDRIDDVLEQLPDLSRPRPSTSSARWRPSSRTR